MNTQDQKTDQKEIMTHEEWIAFRDEKIATITETIERYKAKKGW